MPSLLDLSTELQVATVEYLDTPASSCDPPASYFVPRKSRDLANLGSSCRTFNKLAAPALYRNLCLRTNDKSGKSLQAIGNSPGTAGLVRELNFEAIITAEEGYDELMPLSEEDFPSSVEEVLSHLERFPNLEFLSIHFKLGDTMQWDEMEAESSCELWQGLPDPYRDFDQLQRREERAEFRAIMARTYDAIAGSERPSALTTLELRNLLPAGVSSFNTAPWKAFLGTLKTLRLSMHEHAGGGESCLSTAFGYTDFIQNLDLFFSQLASITEFRFAASYSGLPGLPGQHHAVFPLNVEDMPLLQVLELQCCFVSERTARFIASHVKTLKRVRLEDSYSAAEDYNAEEHTTWARFLNIIADSLEAAENPPLEEFSVTPHILVKSRNMGGHEKFSVPIKGDDTQIELAFSLSKTASHRRPFAYARIDDKYGFLSELENDNLAAFLLGHDQAAYDRVMAVVGRHAVGQ
ncbi:hypothetical protein Q7P35_011182 [Cladosporium inversicolor]